MNVLVWRQSSHNIDTVFVAKCSRLWSLNFQVAFQFEPLRVFYTINFGWWGNWPTDESSYSKHHLSVLMEHEAMTRTSFMHRLDLYNWKFLEALVKRNHKSLSSLFHLCDFGSNCSPANQELLVWDGYWRGKKWEPLGKLDLIVRFGCQSADLRLPAVHSTSFFDELESE